MSGEMVIDPRGVGVFRRPAVVDQPELPFLTAERAALIDAARVAVERAQQSAAAERRWADAEELARLGMQLVDLLEANAVAVRARPPHRPDAEAGKPRAGGTGVY